jgi:hypothetical protein
MRLTPPVLGLPVSCCTVAFEMTCARDVAVRYAEMTIKMNDNLVVAHPTNETARHRPILILVALISLIVIQQYAAQLIIMVT